MSWRGRTIYETSINGQRRVYNIVETMNRMNWLQERQVPIEVYDYNYEVLQKMRWDPVYDRNMTMKMLCEPHEVVPIKTFFIWYGVYEENFVDLTEDSSEDEEDNN